MIWNVSFAQAYREFKVATDALASVRKGEELLPALDRAAECFRELRRALYRAERSARRIKL